jgi:integrase
MPVMKRKKAAKSEALAVVAQALDEPIANAVELWVAATTDGKSVRYRDLARGKRQAVAEFWAQAGGKSLNEIKVTDVVAWEQAMAARDLAANTIAARLSYVSSFFSWLLREPKLAKHLEGNPFLRARRKAPKPYQSEATKALSNVELRDLRAALERHAAGREVQALRDHAIFLLLMYSGMRRAEVLRLRGKDLDWDEVGLIVEGQVKGGKQVRRYVTHASVWQALLAYLEASDRLDVIKHLRAPEVAVRRTAQAERKRAAAQKAMAEKAAAEKESAAPGANQQKEKQGSATNPTALPRELTNSAPLWVRHDPGQAAVAVEQPLAEWTFARRMKTYAAEAGLEAFHLHQTRHTFARIVAETTGSMHQTQEALGHKHLATTRAYVERITTLPDLHSDAIAERMEAGPGKKTQSGKA